MSLISAPARYAKAIGSRGLQVRRIPIQLADGSSGEQNGRAPHLVRYPFIVEKGNSVNAPVLRQQLGGKLRFRNGDMFQGMSLLIQRAKDFRTCGLALCVQYAALAVPGFWTKNELGRMPTVRSPADQLFDSFYSFFHQNLDRSWIAEPIPSGECVLIMERDLILVAQNQGNVGGIGMSGGQRLLGEHEHTAGAGQFNRRAQAGDPGANYHESGLGW